jgi:hypothetical protein
MSDSPTVFIAKESAVLRIDGDKLVIRKGITRVREGHAVLSEFPDYFREVDPATDVHLDVPTVETARQEPTPPTPPAETGKAESGKAKSKAGAGDEGSNAPS